MSSQSITTFDKVGMTANGTALPVTLRIDYAQGNTGVSQEVADGNGNRGILDRRANRMRVVRVPIQPSLDFEPTPLEWEMLLPWLLGGTPTGSGTVTYPAGDDAPVRNIQLREDRDGSEFTHTLSNVLVDAFTIRASQADPLVTCSTQLLAGGYSPNGTVFPDTLEQDNDLDNVGSPFTFADTTATGTGSNGAMTLGGVERECFDVAVSVNYNMDRSRFANSLYLTTQRKRDRIVTVAVTVTPPTAEALYAATLPALTPRAFLVRFQNAATFLEIDIGESLWAWQPQPRPRRGESLVSVVGQAFVTDAIPVFTMKLKAA